jgi:FkbM family methyltransferase
MPWSDRMSEASRLVANLFLRYGSSFTSLRRIPVLGDALSWASRKLLPRDALMWVRIQAGHAEGLWILVNPRTGQSTLQGLGEPVVQQALVDYLGPGMTFYDVGANIGFFSLLAARIVGPFGHVVSFEADPEIAERLRENLARNEFDQATVVQKAVWSEPSTVFFVRVDANISPDRGLGYVATSSVAGNTIAVDAVSLDAFPSSYPSPDFIKCDVEGAEAAVFEGTERLLREKRPILLVEMHSASNYRELTRKFAQFGYRCSDLDENHVLALPR